MGYDPAIDSYDNDWDDIRLGVDIEESFERDFRHLKENLKVRLLNAPMNLENGDVGLKFQLKMFEFMYTGVFLF